MALTAGGKITLSSPLHVMPALRARRFSEWVTRDITHMREIGCNMWLLYMLNYLRFGFRSLLAASWNLMNLQTVSHSMFAELLEGLKSCLWMETRKMHHTDHRHHRRHFQHLQHHSSFTIITPTIITLITITIITMRYHRFHRYHHDHHPSQLMSTLD